MAIKLRENEIIKVEANFHWSSYILSGFWAFIMSYPVLHSLFPFPSEANTSRPSFLLIAAIAYAPLLYVFLKNKSKCYVVTNERLYVEDGVLSKTKTDIPLNKINDISFSQGIFQRMFNSGNLLVLTGNNKTTVLANLEKPEDFREILSRNSNIKANN